MSTLHWAQTINPGRSGFLVGRIDPADYADIAGFANPWTTFQNLTFVINPTIAFPDTGFGFGGGSFIGEQFYFLGVFSDANGQFDKIDFFPGGAEFFKYGEIGWSPSPEERYFRNIHLGIWHTDARDDAQIEENYGIVFSTNWLFGGDRWMAFLRAGLSEGDSPLANAAISTGLIYQPFNRRDLTGLGLSWSSPPDASLRDQYVTELFYRLQIAKNIAITPSIQFIINPSLDPNRDNIFLFGLRTRVTF